MNQSLFPDAANSSQNPAPKPIGATPRVAVDLIVDPTIKTNPPLATIEKFEATDGIVKIACPEGLVTIDARRIGGRFPTDTAEKVGRMINVGLVELFTARRAELGLTLPEGVELKREGAKIFFGNNGSSDFKVVMGRPALAEALTKIMALAGGSLSGDSVEAEATAPDALAKVSGPTVVAPKVAVPAAPPAPKVFVPAPAPRGPAEVKITGVPAKPSNASPVAPVHAQEVRVAVPTAVVAAPAAAAQVNVTLKGTQKLPTVETAITPDTFKLSTGVLFESLSGTLRTVVIDPAIDEAVMYRKPVGSEWAVEASAPVDFFQGELVKNWKAGIAKLLDRKLPPEEIRKLRELPAA